jgi:hypothetical protein
MGNLVVTDANLAFTVRWSPEKSLKCKVSPWVHRSGTIDEAYFSKVPTFTGIMLEAPCWSDVYGWRQTYAGDYVERTIEFPIFDSDYRVCGYYESECSPWIQKLPHGRGTRKLWSFSSDDDMFGFAKRQSTEVFTGEWNYGDKVRGKEIYPNGDSYDGEWSKNQPHGRGVYVYACKYHAPFSNRYLNGCCSGMYDTFHTYDVLPLDGETCFIGSIYEGEWRAMSDVLNVKEQLGSNRIFFKRHGKGKLTLAKGDIFEGEWRSSEGQLTVSWLTGKVKFQGANGDMYEGEWNENSRGSGRMVWANGDTLEGQGTWVGFAICGRGVFTQAYDGTPFGSKHAGHKGEKYDGQFDTKNGKCLRSGSCTYTLFNGETFECYWNQGYCPKFEDRMRVAVASEMKTIAHTMVAFTFPVIVARIQSHDLLS